MCNSFTDSTASIKNLQLLYFTWNVKRQYFDGSGICETIEFYFGGGEVKFMKKFKAVVMKCLSVLCMVAMFLAVHSVNVVCNGRYYQPEVPKELDKFRRI